MVQHTQPTQPSPNNQSPDVIILESQVRECFGRVVWSQKIHEKRSDLYEEQLKTLKISQIILSAATTTSLLTSAIANNRIATIVGTIFSTIVLAITIYTKDYDLGQMAKRHADAANKLWDVRESYISLIADIKTGSLTLDEIKSRRDEIQDSLSLVYKNSPRTNYKAYERASKALNKAGKVNVGEEMTLSDEEIDRFLPHDLRRIL